MSAELPHYSSVKMRCPTCDPDQPGLVSHCDGSGFYSIPCPDCSGGWVDLPATVECDQVWHCGCDDPDYCERVSLGRHHSTRCPGPSPAPWALALPGDEVLWTDRNGTENRCGIVISTRVDSVWVDPTDDGNGQIHKSAAFTRIVTPGSDHEQARAEFGVGWDGQR